MNSSMDCCPHSHPPEMTPGNERHTSGNSSIGLWPPLCPAAALLMRSFTMAAIPWYSSLSVSLPSGLAQGAGFGAQHLGLFSSGIRLWVTSFGASQPATV